MKVKNILISQPPPSDLEKSPYRDLAEKYNLKLEFHKFFKIEGIPAREFRLDRININDHNAIIFTSRLAVDHFFRIAKEMRAEIPDTLKYFCISEAIALYLQKYVQYRKRKIFHGKQQCPELMDIILKHKEDKFLLPCSDIHKQDMSDLLDKYNIKYNKAIIYKTVDDDLSWIDIKKYDLLIFFSPSGVKSLLNNFPDFQQENILIAAFGDTTAKAIEEANLTLHITAPTKVAPSMAMALEQYIIKLAKKK